MNMENNSAHMCESSGRLMEDDIFGTGADIIGGVDYSAMLGNFPDFHRADLVLTDSLWTGRDFIDGQQLPEQYHIAAPLDEAYPQVMEIPQISSSSLHSELFGNNLDPYSRSKLNSAFRTYRKESTKEVQLCLAHALKQKSLKRCFDFLRRTYKNIRDSSSWEVNDVLVEESYALTHKIDERNRRTKLSQQFLALRSLVPHNPKKVDKISTLFNAISELNRKKRRILELEKLNQSLTIALTQHSASEGCSSLSYGCAAESRRYALMHCICEEADVLVEKTSIPDEAMIEVTLTNIASNCTHMDAIVTVDKCLREMELKVVRIQWRDLGSANQLIEGTIRRKTKVTKFKCGGVALGTALQHILSDGVSSLHFVNSWCDVARGLQVHLPPHLDRSPLRARNPPRVSFSHEEFAPPPTLVGHQEKDDENVILQEEANKVSFGRFNLSKEQVNALKDKASENPLNKTYSTYVSLAAHIWKCCTTARGLLEKQRCKLYTPVDGRGRLCRPPLPCGYYGNAVFMATPIDIAGEIMSNPLWYSAEKIHESIAKMDDEYLRSGLDFLEIQPDLNAVVRRDDVFKCPNMSIVSWTRLPFYEADFGWGRPSVLGPATTPTDGLCRILPTPTNDGSVSVCLALLRDDMVKFGKLLYEF